ncbi:choline-sulfatase [Shimia gijangensis]|uniref:Choline-sulfatase n=1 Tax=Shimia gijangensis TaxID=1470563 RepID=A0A1M6EKC7_9RHOB|nr:sulfatase-like hydrolase/transferase [Shimia gijangensis]SHI85995.1 choline-sulfatase [Shimia gijangensis]
MPADTHPNILLIMTDQMPPFMLEACGYPQARTRHMSALAQRSVAFTNAYSPSPICVPARSCFMTGMHTSTTGCYDNGDPFDSFIPTFAHYLTNAGYDTVLAGKMHFIGADQLHGFKRRLNTDVYPSGFIWSYPMPPEDDPDFQAFDFVAQYVSENIGPGWSKELQYDEETHFRSLEYLRHTPEEPWMLTVSFTNPHPPYKVPSKYWEMYKDADLDVPQFPEDMDQRYSGYDRLMRRWLGLDREGDRIRDPENLLAMRRGFAALAHYVDDKIGELIEVLEEQGLREDTIVILTSDHGEMLGEKGMIQKRHLYEWSTRIPLFIDMPGAPASKVETPVSLIDLPSTLVEMAGQTPAVPMEGRSLMPALRGEALEVVPIISEYHGEGIMRPAFMVRVGDWKYIYCHGEAPQLFNLVQDPDEWNNLSGRPEHAKLENELDQIITGGRFDLDKIGSDVWDRLKMKNVVNAAMDRNSTAWDYQVDQNATSQYVRR